MEEREHSACGVGFVASRRGVASRAHVEMGLQALCCVEHRGACGADGRSSDGAGIMTDIPWDMLGQARGTVAVAALFVPAHVEAQRQALAVLQETFAFHGLRITRLRDVPTDDAVLGAEARASRPAIKHAIIARPEHCRTDASFNKLLYLAKQDARTRMVDRGLGEAVFFVSLSTNTVVYKALTRAEDLGRFYADLRDARYTSRFCVFHRRFSTNTRTSWDKAQPFRVIAHNGEINTLKGNRSWGYSREKSLGLRSGELLTQKGISDTGSLNEMAEALLHRSSIPHLHDAMAILVPPAGSALPFHRFWSRAMEPWDGPAFLVYSDGLSVGARLDRNGFRPSRWAMTEEHFFLASEAGAFGLDESIIHRKGRLAAGTGVKVDLASGDVDFSDPGASEDNRDAPFDARLLPVRPVHVAPEPVKQQQLHLFGYTEEDVERLLVPMAATGKEPIGSMGDTARPAVLSSEPRPFFDYFHQDFAQVTNPPVDYLREGLVTDLRVMLGKRPNVFSPKELIPPPVALELQGPVLSCEDMAFIRQYEGDHPPDPRVKVRTLPMLFTRAHGLVGMQSGLEELARHAVAEVARGTTILVLSDEDATPEMPPLPSLLAVRAVINALNDAGTRLEYSLVVHTGEVRDAHQLSALVSFGAAAVCPYLALRAVAHLQHDDLAAVPPPLRTAHVKSALEAGLLKVMSKMGISVVRSYQSSRLFSAVGIGKGLQKTYFPGLYSPIGGIELPEVHEAVEANATRAATAGDTPLLHTYQFKEHARGQHGERHSMTAARSRLIHKLAREKDLPLHSMDLYDAYLQQGGQGAPVNLRHLLAVESGLPPLDVDAVEPREAILRRLGAGAMSFGAISAPAQRDIILAMRAVGGRSNSGEGGENPFQATEGVEASTKQVASARFGVTSAYLANASEVQIKVAQGAKPGEGGQLMGVKVTVEIAHARHARPGVDLISPPPMHDIYSIEDLKQLIYELRQVNPAARVSVKLVSGAELGPIAVGVAKAGADIIHISGADGGTGAAGLLSMKHAGLPFELGLVAAHRALAENGLRRHVVLRTDGGLSTGMDVVMAAVLGAEEFDLGKSILVAQGCIMARVCEKNTCPTGIATHDPKFLAKYKGEPAHIIRFLTTLAQDVRRVLARLGLRTLDEALGRTDLLRVAASCEDLVRRRRLDLGYLLQPPVTDRFETRNPFAEDVSPFNASVLAAARLATEGDGNVVLRVPIRTTDRAAFATLAGELGRLQRRGTPARGTFTAHVGGSAGQGFGVFNTEPMTLHLRGEANDSVAKSMSGGLVTVRPAEGSTLDPGENTILGNTALYGATGGMLLCNGQAGDRFAIRNSGATAVVEGVGNHCCEYMTGGTVLVLGPVGANAAAGMTGGTLFTWGVPSAMPHPQYVVAEPLDEEDLAAVRALLVKHAEHTGSPRARMVLSRWEQDRSAFHRYVPHAMTRAARSRASAPPPPAPLPGEEEAAAP